jgi:hypothetical protein
MIASAVIESGMTFDAFDADRFVYWENSNLCKSFGEGFKTAEFIFIDNVNPERFNILEAKNSVPNPENPKSKESFLKYIRDVVIKFADTSKLFTSSLLHFKIDVNNELPPSFVSHNFVNPSMRYILVVNGAKKAWLRPVTEALRDKMKKEIKIWNAQVVAITAEEAKHRGWVTNIV